MGEGVAGEGEEGGGGGVQLAAEPDSKRKQELEEAEDEKAWVGRADLQPRVCRFVVEGALEVSRTCTHRAHLRPAKSQSGHAPLAGI